MDKPGKGTTFSMTLVWCAGYFFVVMGLGVLGRAIFDSPIWYVIVVAAVSFLFAWYFSQRTEYFHKDAVDFFYYTVGVIGIVLTFWGQAPERAGVTERIAVRELEAQSDRATQTLEAFEATVSRWEMIFAGIIANPNAYLDEVKRARAENMVRLTESESQACARALFGSNAVRLPEVRLDPTRPQLGGPSNEPNLRDPIDQALAEAACDEAMKRVSEERLRVAAAMVLTLEDIRNDAAMSFAPEDIRNSAHVAADTGMLRVADASDSEAALVLIGDPTRLAVLRTSLEQMRVEARSAYQGRRENLDQLLADLRFQESTLVGLLRFHFWPYVLILLLSLKLSRPRVHT